MCVDYAPAIADIHHEQVVLHLGTRCGTAASLLRAFGSSVPVPSIGLRPAARSVQSSEVLEVLVADAAIQQNKGNCTIPTFGGT